VTLVPSALARLAGLVVVAVVVQLTLVSQLPLLGVSADLSPLIVMAVGLLAGSIPGAVTGFSMGLFVDLALVQTLGVSSLLLVVVGYGAGRLRELRDPAHGAVPVAVGAAATAVATVGFSLLQFLLGVEAPVSLLLVREILVAIGEDPDRDGLRDTFAYYRSSIEHYLPQTSRTGAP